MRGITESRNIRRIALTIAALAIITTSYALLRIARIGDQVKVLNIEKVELKGLTGLLVAVEIDNESPFDITMNNASATLKIDGKKSATLTQVEPHSSVSGRRETISTLWRISNIDPFALMLLSSKILQQDYSAMTIDFSADLTAGSHTKTLTGEDVDISQFVHNLIEE